MNPPPLNETLSGASPGAVIGIPACTAKAICHGKVKGALPLFLLAKNILAEGIRPLHSHRSKT